MRKTALFILFLMLVAHAEDYVVINSMDGRDVLSGIFYAKVKDYPVRFMPYPGGDADILAAKVGTGHDILLIQSEEQPVSAFVQQALERNNNTIELYTSPDGGTTNLDLAIKSGAKEFFIVDSAFADSALSVMPYANLKDAYIIFSGEYNVDSITDIVADADKVTIYGYVDSAVREALEEFNPETIGRGEDRYEDNVELAGMMMEEYDLNSIIMVEGNFVEEGMVDSQIPIVFSGRLVPTTTYNFVKQKVRNGELTTVYLIGGTQITNAVRNMREQIREEFKAEGVDKDFGIWLRFAQIVPGQKGMSTLDTFPLPAYIPKLDISEVVYNTATGNIMVTVDNTGYGPAYYLSEVHILVNDVEYAVLGGAEVSLIEQGDTVGIEYPFDISEIEEGEITAVVIVKYGSGRNTLEEYDDYIGELLEVQYVDQSNVTAREARYDSSKEVLFVSLKNNREETAYASPEVTLLIDGSPTKIRGPYNEPIEGNSIVVAEFPISLSSEDIAANEEVTVNLKYGGRPGFLVKEGTFTLSLEKEGGIDLSLVLVILVVVLLLLVIYIALTRKGKGKR